ncbi:MAG TPA: NAD-dependent epimerase/dehydratase family protein, partial [Demequinaceae bacterium]
NEFTMEMMTKGKLVVFGEQFWRPYIHVRDAARALALVLGAPETAVRGRVFNVGATKENYQKKQLVELIKPQAPGAVVEYVHRDEDPRDYRVSFERVRSELGFETIRTVPDGIAEVARLVRSGVLTDFADPRYRN